jgi:hypothetical protein
VQKVVSFTRKLEKMVGFTGEISGKWGFEDAKQVGSLIWLNLRWNF